MSRFVKKIDKPLYKHSIFWVVIFLFYTTSSRERFDTVEEIIITYSFHIVFQICVAYTTLYFIIPRYKKTKRIFELLLFFILLFFLINFMFVFVRMSFLEVFYPNCYQDFLEKHGHLTFIDRVFSWKHIFIDLPLFYLQPLFFLVALQFYEKQQKLSHLNEQKKITELKTLKQQLNPHFLFNTLNNLYLLAVEKSDKTPGMIEKLSNILDYMLYGCEDKFVSIKKEIELIENYLTLEQIRYDDRVVVSFKNSVTENVKIAPLLLLTFIENAFKHGVKHEIETAKVMISLSLNKEYIVFTVSNSKPLTQKTSSKLKKHIGLTNVEQQLSLLYPDAYTLNIEDKKNEFIVNLKLKKV